MQVWAPTTADQTVEAVREALTSGARLEIVGRGSRRAFGRPSEADVRLDLSKLDEVVTYQPEELVLTVQPGAPLAEIEALLARRGQQLAFEPPDLGALWGAAAGKGSIGGAALTGLGGPRRLTAGAPRDHTLGVKGVNGFGQAFAAGGRVVKNVTGFDISKLVCGSFGTLCAVTEMSFKVLPAAPDAITLVVAGLSEETGQRAMSHALGTPAAVTSAAHLPQELAARSASPTLAGLGASATLLRLEGVTPSVRARADHLEQAMASAGPIHRLDLRESQVAWREIADASLLAEPPDAEIWRISVPPTLGPKLGQALGGRRFYDAGGGVLWGAAASGSAARIRAAVAQIAGADGHATLIRAPAEVRSHAGPFQPLAPPLAALTARVKQQFDPEAIFNRGRMYEGV
jgi:glycolate oxidase FAD binding subunit